MLDNRNWKPRGFGLIGEATDGRRAVEVTIRPIGEGTDPTPEQRRTLAEELAAAHNAHGQPELSQSQKSILAAIRDHETHEGRPTTVAQIRARTGFSPAWIHEALDQMADLGVISRPPKTGPGERRPRPVRSVPVGGAS